MTLKRPYNRAEVDPIGVAKAVLWEEAKGKLRALVAVSGQVPSDSDRGQDWQKLEVAVENFILNIEDDGLHE